MFSTDSSSCSPCNCKETRSSTATRTRGRSYGDGRSEWDRIISTVEAPSKTQGYQSYRPGAFKDMAGLEGPPKTARGSACRVRKAVFRLLNLTLSRVSANSETFVEKNKIHIVKSNAFLGLHRLNWLELNNNQIQTLEAGAFLGLHNLHNLRLYTNNINRIENGTFAGLDSLRWIELEWNQINNIEDGAFAGLASLRGVDPVAVTCPTPRLTCPSR